MLYENITSAQLEAEVRRLAAAEPDFVYRNQLGIGDNCSYIAARIGGDVGRPCIFGQAFQNLGVSVEDLRAVEGRKIGSAFAFLTGGRAPEGWTRVQEMQDEGCSWGEAIGGLTQARVQ